MIRYIVVKFPVDEILWESVTRHVTTEQIFFLQTTVNKFYIIIFILLKQGRDQVTEECHTRVVHAVSRRRGLLLIRKTRCAPPTE
jgi:hypothetical protein